MPVTERQRTVLMGVLEDHRNLTNTPMGERGGSRIDLGRQRIIARNAQAGLVPMNLEGWLGRAPTNSDRVMYHHEYIRLEGMGLIQRCNLTGGRRTTHLKLTRAGRRLAEALWEEEFGRPDEDIDWANVEFLPIEMPSETDDGDPGALSFEEEI